MTSEGCLTPTWRCCRVMLTGGFSSWGSLMQPSTARDSTRDATSSALQKTSHFHFHFLYSELAAKTFTWPFLQHKFLFLSIYWKHFSSRSTELVYTEDFKGFGDEALYTFPFYITLQYEYITVPEW